MMAAVDDLLSAVPKAVLIAAVIDLLHAVLKALLCALLATWADCAVCLQD